MEYIKKDAPSGINGTCDIKYILLKPYVLNIASTYSSSNTVCSEVITLLYLLKLY